MNRQAGRSGRNWRTVRLAVLRASGGICSLCGQTRCPTCGRAACQGTPAPGQVDHRIPPDLAPSIAEDPANLRAAHGHCNKARNRLGVAAVKISSREW